QSTYALGATTAEVVWQVVLPYARGGGCGGGGRGLRRPRRGARAGTCGLGDSHAVHGRVLRPGATLTAAHRAWLGAAPGEPRAARGSSGELLTAIAGSLAMTAIATLVGTPTGILAGTFLAEYARGSRFGEVVRFVNDILLSAPSIIIGLFVYEAMVVRMGHFSAWAGAMALAIITIPVVVRTTEDMLRLVPSALREAAAALGAPKWKVIVMVTYRAAVQGIVTGVLLAVARISGETAPLLFTALNNQFWSTDLNRPMANLPVV